MTRRPAGQCVAWLWLPVLLLASRPGIAADLAVAWKGILYCSTIPGLTHLALREPVELLVAGRHVSFDRNVRRADTSQDSGYVEHASGNLATDGGVTLIGGATVGATLSYTATYVGRLPLGGGITSLIGTQVWVGPAVGRFERPCHIELSR